MAGLVGGEPIATHQTQEGDLNSLPPQGGRKVSSNAEVALFGSPQQVGRNLLELKL